MALKYFQAALPVLFLSAGIGMCEDLGSDLSQETTWIAPGETASFEMDATPGTYVRGRLHSLGHPFDLSLTDKTGMHVRRLLDDNTGAGQFHVVIGEQGQQFRALNDGDVGAEVTLEIERIVPPDEQIGNAKSYLSPIIAALSDGGDTAEFWAARAVQGTPMVEPSTRDGQIITTFLWRGAEKNVRLWGGPAADHMWMDRLGDTDVWYISFEMPDSGRLSYGFSPDVPQFDGSMRENRVALLATLQADPLNKTPIYSEAPDQWAQRSLFEAPNAPVQPGMDGQGDFAEGTIEPGLLRSDAFSDRRVDYYRPADFDANDPNTVLLVMFDGPAYQTERAPIPQILDRLIADSRLPQVAVAFIDPVDGDQRGVDLTCNPEFLDVLANDWLPQVESTLKIAPTAAQRVVSGSSYGGLASACLVHRHPETFGNAVVLSGSFWWAPQGYEGQGTPYVSALWMDNAPKDVRIWMSAGIYEISRLPGSVSIFETTRHLRDVLTLQGIKDVTYREFVGGHDYLVWRGALAEGLLHLFGD
ncbi:enterochelin esterase family protein [Yoonia maritima]|uniref:Enterochelin esterase family protein n=2 Tax=Yoonia maritima TaxID=1435347 RepID=A0A2T0VZD7_9RHOB|nr:enterochelin esterase family protein [Yoonia maritima]